MPPSYRDRDRSVMTIPRGSCVTLAFAHSGLTADACGESYAIAPVVLAASVIATRAKVSRSKPLICQAAIVRPPCPPNRSAG